MNLPLREFADAVAALKAAAERPGMSEHRQSARMNVSARIDVHLMDHENIAHSFTVMTRNISLSGLALLQTRPVKAGEHMIVALPRHATPIYVRAIIKHSQNLAEGLLAIGLEFDKVIDTNTFNKLLSARTSEHDRLRRSIID